MNRKQRRRLVRNGKMAVVCGAMLYLAVGVKTVGMDKESSVPDLVIAETSEQIVIPQDATESQIYASEHDDGSLEYPFNLMSHDWGGEELEGWKPYQIPEEDARYGGYLPECMQKFIYIVCNQNDVDYPLVLAMIGVESSYKWDAVSECHAVGYMQIVEKWHTDRMDRLNVSDLENPYSNVMVGIDYMAELLEEYPVEVALGIYNMGWKAADLWEENQQITGYAKAVMARYMEISEEMAE